MNNVISLFDPDRYCLTCKKVDCPDHCRGCGAAHSHTENLDSYCTACVFERADEDLDLSGFWSPPNEPQRRGMVCVEHIDEYRTLGKADLAEDVVIELISNLMTIS